MNNPPTRDPSEEPPAKRNLITGIERPRLAPLLHPENMPMDDNMPEPPGIPRAQVNQRMVDFERQQQDNNNGENGENNGEIQEEQQRGGKRSRKSRTRRSRTRKSRRSRKSRHSRRYRH